MLTELLSNRIILSGLIGWASAQILKTIIYALVNRKLDLTRLVGDGGMPSAHSGVDCPHLFLPCLRSLPL